MQILIALDDMFPCFLHAGIDGYFHLVLSGQIGTCYDFMMYALLALKNLRGS